MTNSLHSLKSQILLFRDFILFHMFGWFAYVYMYVTYAAGAYRGQQRVFQPLELQMQVAVSHCVGADD